MTLQEFVNKYNGKSIDFDGAYGPQCVDLIRQYIKEVWGTQQPPSVQGAYQLLENASGYQVFLHGQINRGDVIVWNKGYGENGHTAVVLQSNSQQVQVFEQNNPVGSKCHTAWHNYGSIRGWFRPVSQLQKTFMAITVVANNNWPTLQTQLDKVKQMFIDTSGNRFEPVFNIVSTNFQNIPYAQFEGRNCVDINWYRNNITPLARGQATIFLIGDGSPHEADGGNLYGDPGRPVRIELHALESEMAGTITNFEELTFHEICHALLFLTGQKDLYTDDQGKSHFVVHDFLYQNPPQYQSLAEYIDQKSLQSALIKIK
jgi:CHAP domain